MKQASRPKTLIGLTARAIRLRRRSVGACAFFLLVLLAIACLAFSCGHRELTVATFNIENFPRDSQQIEGAFETIASLDAPIVAVQEILEPEVFEQAAQARLGASWRFVTHPRRDERRDTLEQHVGLLYDSDRYTLSYTRTHRQTQIDGRGKPAFEVRLRPRGAEGSGGRAVRLFVLHLKAGGDFAHVRREQLRRLEPVLAEAVESWDEIVVLGDFNATGPEDRQTIARLAARLRLTWATEHLACTSYWDRRDGCWGSALDHVLTRGVPEGVRARGPCETIGCDRMDQCPAFHREVSDHCPVTVSF